MNLHLYDTERHDTTRHNKEDTHELGVVEDHMSPWGVAKKEMCCYQLVLRLQKGKDDDQP